MITRDGRTTGPMIAAAAKASLMAAGRACLDAGIAATPTTGVLVKHTASVGGIQISASHNPAEYNGLKLFNQEGRVIPAEAGQQVLETYRNFVPAWQSYDQIGVSHSVADTTTAHLALVSSICDVERIRERNFSVLLDANNGSGSCLGVPLLQELGCKISLLGGDPDGLFGHPAEPTCENLSGVLPLFQEQSFDIGFCQDPDADRLAIIDESGHYIGEEFTVSLCIDHMLRQNPGPVVTNCSTSRMTQDLAKKYGVPFYHSKVGEANVVDLMLTEKAVLGGEGNGGIIDPRVGLVRDSFVGIALLLDAMAAREQPISVLANEMPHYAIHKTKVNQTAEKVPDALNALEKHFSEAASDRLDGLRLDWEDQWLLVRASNTVPIVRVIAEAQTANNAQHICEEAASVLSAV